VVLLSDHFLVFGRDQLSGEQRKWPIPVLGAEDETGAATIGGSTTEARSPMPGIVEKVFVAEGDHIVRDQVRKFLSRLTLLYCNL
jgi:hypothetical protein